MENQATITEFDSILASRGVTRRDFMKLAGAVAVAAGLTELAAPRVAQALEESVIGATKGDLYPVIWIEGASCTGCTESFAQVETPDVATVVLDLISLNYSETLSAAAGHSVEESRQGTTFLCMRVRFWRLGAATPCASPARWAPRPWSMPLRAPTRWSRWAPARSTAAGARPIPTPPTPWASRST